MSEALTDRVEQLRRLRRWLAASDRLDRLIEETEPPHQTQPLPVRTAGDRGRDAMWDRTYVDEKLRELERERLARRAFVAERQREAGAIVRAAKAAGRPRGLRAGFASRLARIALTLHREAATDAGMQPRTESPR